MNTFHVLMMKIPFQAQEKAGPARWLVQGFALTPAAKLSQGTGTRSREGAELLGLILVQKCALSTA